MRIKSNVSELKENQPGKLTLICDNDEDVWAFYNVLLKGDLIQKKVSRKVAQEKDNGSKTVKTVYIIATIKVESIDYDQECSVIRVNGKNVTENENMSKGQYQSAPLGKHEFFSIIKRSWDKFSIDRVLEASNPITSSDLAICLMEEGLCNIFLVSSTITIRKCHIETSIPKKRKGPSNYDKQIIKFFNKIIDGIKLNINFDIVKCFVIGSPGFLRDQFNTFVNEKISLNDLSFDYLKKNKSKFLLTHCSNAHKNALNEILSKSEILAQISTTKAFEDVHLMSKFDKVLGTDYERIIFGIKQLDYAILNKAVDLVLVSDSFLRKFGPEYRKVLSKKFNTIEEQGGTVKIMSSMHSTGVKINNLGGIAAVLKFILEDIDDIEQEPEEIIQEKIVDEEIDVELLEDDIGKEQKEIEELKYELSHQKKELHINRKLSVDRKLSLDEDL